MLENPWPSEAWNTEEMQQVIALGLECNKIDMCSFNLRDRESGLLHRKGTCIATDSPGISETLQGKVCPGGHQHQPLEGKNAYMEHGANKPASTLWSSAKPL